MMTIPRIGFRLDLVLAFLDVDPFVANEGISKSIFHVHIGIFRGDTR